MGHYDECREGYCGICGQTEGNCLHTRKDPQLEYIKAGRGMPRFILGTIPSPPTRLELEPKPKLGCSYCSKDNFLVKIQTEICCDFSNRVEDPPEMVWVTIIPRFCPLCGYKLEGRTK